MKDKKQQLKYVSPHDLIPNPWNPNEVDPINQEKLNKSISKGFFKPVIVRTLDDGTLQILGGQHSTDAAKSAGMKEIPIFNLGKISDAEAKSITIKDNSRYGEINEIKMADILGSGEIGDAQLILSEFPIDEDYLSNIFSHEMDDVTIDDLDMDLDDEDSPVDIAPATSGITHQIIRFKVPTVNAHLVTEVIERIKEEQDYNSSDDLTNSGDALVYLMRGMADDE